MVTYIGPSMDGDSEVQGFFAQTQAAAVSAMMIETT